MAVIFKGSKSNERLARLVAGFAFPKTQFAKVTRSLAQLFFP